MINVSFAYIRQVEQLASIVGASFQPCFSLSFFVKIHSLFNWNLLAVEDGQSDSGIFCRWTTLPRG